MRIPNLAASLFYVSAASGLSMGQQPGATDVSGSWIITADLFGTSIYERMELTQSGTNVTGKFTGDKITSGEALDGTLHLVAMSDDGTTSEVNAKFDVTTLTGTAVETDPKDKDHSRKYSFTAKRVEPLQHRAPRRHEFTPTVFYRQFSPSNKPVLTIAPGDSVHTTTVDAGGADEKGVVRVLGGNPETGPFYIEGAEPGDTLVVHILKLRLNRDYAISDDALLGAAETHVGLRCTAVGPALAPPPTGDSGGYGGNMDFNEIGEGATVYLPVANPGALLYLGDAHAEQGDGELNGNALETSADVEFSVDVIPGNHLFGRRIEGRSTNSDSQDY